MSLKNCIIDKIKKTDAYQKKKEKAYYLRRECMLSQLLSDEKFSNKRHVYLKQSKVEEFNKLFDLIDITIRPGNRFQTWIDTGLYFSNIYALEDNTTPNYELILDNSINDLICISSKYKNNVSREVQALLNGILSYIDRIVEKIEEVISVLNDPICIDRLRKTKTYFLRMKENKCSSLEEALQRILFWSSIFCKV